MGEIIYYDTRTGNVRKFMKKLGPNVETLYIGDIQDQEIAPGKLVTYTIGYGQIPAQTKEFLSKHNLKITSVSSSGNRNWGDNFGKALDKIVELYPHIKQGVKFELSGGSEDIINFLQHAGTDFDASN